MRTLLYLLFLACLVPLLFFASWVRWIQSLTWISRSWARLRGAATWPIIQQLPGNHPRFLN
jgi:hypothetical protein